MTPGTEFVPLPPDDGSGRRFEAIQDFLDGLLTPEEEASFREAIERSPELAREVEDWRALFSGLRSAGEAGAVPTPLAGRVMAAVQAEAGHPAPELWLEELDGTLPLEQRLRLGAHRAECPSCQSERTRWAELLAHLDSVPRSAPPSRFRDRVMGRIRVEARVAHPSDAFAAEWFQDLATLFSGGGRAVRWAVALGVAALGLGPLVLAGALAAWIAASPVLSVPIVLASLGWGARTLWATALETAAAPILENLSAIAVALAGMAQSAPGVAIAGLLAIYLLVPGSAWILYRTLLPLEEPDERLAS